MKKNSYIWLIFVSVLLFTTELYSEVHYKLDSIFPSYSHQWDFGSGVCSPIADSKDQIYLIDNYRNILSQYTPSGYLINKIKFKGGSNHGPDIMGPIAIDDNDKLYLIERYSDDANKDHIRIVNISNNNIITFKDLGEAYPEISRILDLKYLNNKIYLLFEVNNKYKILIFDIDGSFLSSYLFDGNSYHKIISIAPTLSGDIYFSHIGNNDLSSIGISKIINFSYINNVLREINKSDYSQKYGISSFFIDRDKIFIYTQFLEPIANYTTRYVLKVSIYQSDGKKIADKEIFNNSQIDYTITNFCNNNLISKISTNRFSMSHPSQADLYFFTFDEENKRIIIDRKNNRYFGILTDISLFDNKLYVVDHQKDSVFIFNKNFKLLDQWSISRPYAIAKNNEDFYVTISEASKLLNSGVVQLSSTGKIINKWGQWGNNAGDFKGATGITISNNKLFIADTYKDEIQVFDMKGNYLYHWGEEGGSLAIYPDPIFPLGHQVYNSPKHITAYEGNIYIPVLYDILKFNLQGGYTSPIYTDTLSSHNFNKPSDIEFDDLGNIFIANKGIGTNFGHNYIHIYDGDGKLITNIGGLGNLPHKLKYPNAIAVDEDKLYIADTGNKRVVVYRKVDRPDNSKAIIIAGGSTASDPLWEQIQANANHAFNALASQGYRKENIYYLNANTKIDLDGNGKADDVDDLPTLESVRKAITEWASDVDNVVIYMIDHGGNETYQLNASEILHAEQLSNWLNILQSEMTGKVILIYDACSSGTFLSVLGETGYDRTIITSTQNTEAANFNDATSFSNLFWGQIFNGKSIREAFVLARDSTAIAYRQHPQIDNNGDGKDEGEEELTGLEQQYIGSGTINNGSAPKIAQVSHTEVANGENIASIIAQGVYDAEGIRSVWGVVTPPHANLTQEGVPVQNKPQFKLSQQGSDPQQYQGSFSGFDQPGIYEIAVYAQDIEGNTSFPKILQIVVDNPLSNKAIILAGVNSSKKFSINIKNQANYAYDVLKSQGYSPDSIEYLSASSVLTEGVDKGSTKSGLKNAITEWATNNSIDVVVYLISDLKDSQFVINETEKLDITELDTWLDTLQTKIKGTMTIIHEGDFSGHIVTSLTPPENKQRIIISSSSMSEASQNLSNGSISFSHFFWNQIRQGSDIAHAFQIAQAAMRNYQSPQLNDNGNTISNEKSDRRIARQHKIGVGILLAADEPKIQNVSANIILESNEAQSALWVDGIVSTSEIKEVWAIITPPEYNPVLKETSPPYKVILAKIGENHWEINQDGFNKNFGYYQIAYYAKDKNDRISQPTTRYVYQPVGKDAYEGDDNFESAKVFQTSSSKPQIHNFHQQNDTDYIRFTVKKSFGQYTIKVNAEKSKADPVIAIYNKNHQLVMGTIDDTASGEQELAYFTPTEDGYYYLKVTPFIESNKPFPSVTGYGVQIYPTNAPISVQVKGKIRNEEGSPIVDAIIRTSAKDFGDYTETNSSGEYILKGYIGNYSLSVEAKGYKKQTKQLSSKAEDKEVIDFTLEVSTEEKPELPPIDPKSKLIILGKLPTTKVSKQTQNVVMQIIKIKVPTGGADLGGITLKGVGRGDEAIDVKKVRLYLDSNKNNKIDVEDEQLASGSYTQDNGKTTLILATKKHFNAGSIQLMVGYDFN